MLWTLLTTFFDSYLTEERANKFTIMNYEIR